jgi:23S rRNA (cytidine2498-2'-O)-methyltransferase
VIRAAYLAAAGFEATLAEEAARAGVTIGAWHDRLALSPDLPAPLAWAQDIWLAPTELPPAEARIAMQHGRWAEFASPPGAAPLAVTVARDARLHFPAPLPPASGAFTRLAADRVLFSARRQSPFIEGRARFHEILEPPSRAYLKLFEALTLLGAHPGPGDLCYDLGAAPGGWTFVCASLSARVVAFDRAPLAPGVAAMLGVRHRPESAFGVDPRREPRVDWLVCDVIAYPPRSLALVRRWLDAGRAARIVATVKFQGATDHDTAEAFQKIPGGRLVHLSHNRHELTFLWPSPASIWPAGLWPNQRESTA